MEENTTQMSQLVGKLYLLPQIQSITLEQLTQWYVSHIDCFFTYDPGRHVFHPTCREASQVTEHSQTRTCDVIHVSPMRANDDTCTTVYRYGSETEVRSIQRNQQIVLMLDGSSSLLQPNSQGYCYLTDAIQAVRIVLEQLAFPVPIQLPQSGYPLSDLKIIVSIVLVVPGLPCQTLLSGWRVESSEIVEVITHLTRTLLKVKRHLAVDEISYPLNTLVGETNVLIEMLKYGTMTASILAEPYVINSLILFTDGALSIQNPEVLDRSLAHLRSERLRLCFILLHDHSSPSSVDNVESPEGHALQQVLSSATHIPQLEAATFLAHSTGGFSLSFPKHLLPHSHRPPLQKWNNLKEALLTISITCTSGEDQFLGNLNWSPMGTLQLPTKMVKASLRSVLSARLRDGYRIRSLVPMTMTPGPKDESIPPNLTDHRTELMEANELSDSKSLLQLTLDMPWKMGVIFRTFICGLWTEESWPEDPHALCTNHALSPIVFHEPHGESQVTFSLQQWPGPCFTCQVSVQVLASYSVLNAIAGILPKQASAKVDRGTLPGRFVIHVRQTGITDQQLELLQSFSVNADLSSVPKGLRLCQLAAFTTSTDTEGRRVVAVNPHLQTDGNNSTEAIRNFMRFWRQFLMMDLSECYRWMDVHHLCGILEADSELPVSLHLPTEINQTSVSITCRQSANRLYACIASWCSFVLVENRIYIRLLDSSSICSTVDQSTTDASAVAQIISEDLSPAQMHQLENVTKSFCIVHVDCQSPEFRVSVAFVASVTQPLEQMDAVEELRQILEALRFPPRGRQAIPKSRHKSGNIQPCGDNVSIPPLQRAWEDTPCCHLFHVRLNRLILNTGTWTGRWPIELARNTSHCRPQPRMGTGRHTSEGSSARYKSVRDGRLRNNFGPLSLDWSLIASQLHHEARVWVIQPVPLATEGIRMLFSSLLNLRLQEGFHIVRVGPQAGFISLARQVWLSNDQDGMNRPCLVQYQLYPVMIDGPKSLESLNSHASARLLSDTIHHLVEQHYNEATIPVDVAAEGKYPHRSVQIMTEVWVQPIEGKVLTPTRESEHWRGARFNQLAGHLFKTDECCVKLYVTLERLCSALHRPSPCSAHIFQPSATKCHSMFNPMLGYLQAGTNVCWAAFDLVGLLKLAPQVLLLYPFLSNASDPRLPTTDGSNTLTRNELLLTTLCGSLLDSNHTTELEMTEIESNSFMSHLRERGTLSYGACSNSNLPYSTRWRCFVGLGGFASASCNAHELMTSKSLVTLLFIPASVVDAQNPELHSLYNNHMVNESIPIVLYVCSRPYMSSLIDDRWTYTRPTDSVFDRRQCGWTRPVNDRVPLDTPSEFLQAGCQNSGLTSELIILWGSLRRTVGVVDEGHVDAYSRIVYRCLVARLPVQAPEVHRVVTEAERRITAKPFTMDVTSFGLISCQHAFATIQQTHIRTGEVLPSIFASSEDYHVSKSCDNQNSTKSERQKWYISNDSLQSIESCTTNRAWGFASVIECYASAVSDCRGLFILQSRLTNEFQDTNFKQTNLCHAFKEKHDNVSLVEGSSLTGQTMGDSIEVPPLPPPQTTPFIGTSNPVPNMNNNTMRHSAKRTMEQAYSDPVVKRVRKWFDTEKSGISQPLFVRVDGLLSYGEKTIRLPLVAAVPMVCCTQMAGLLTQATNLLISEPTFCSEILGRNGLDLSMVRMHLEVIPIVWISAAMNGDTDAPKPNPDDSSQPFSCATLSVDEVSEKISRWIDQSDLQKLTESQQSLLCRFVLRLAWEMEKETVSSLRLFTPVPDPILHRVLLHIEDTQKLLKTPLFDETPQCMLAGHLHPSSSEEDHLSQSPITNTIASLKRSFIHPKEAISVTRIPLDFVVYNPTVFRHFVARFERLSFTSEGLSLEYSNDCYFLRIAATNETPSTSNTIRGASLSTESRRLPGNYGPVLHETREKRRSHLVSQTGNSTSESSSDTNSNGYEGDTSEPSADCRSSSIQDIQFEESSVLNLHQTPPIHPPPPPPPIESTAEESSVYKMPPYWLLFRLCTNSASLFFHHIDTHCPNSTALTLSTANTIPSSGDSQTNYRNAGFILPPSCASTCRHCEVHLKALKSIRLLVRIVNQQLLLDKLRIERMCDPLLVAPPAGTGPVPPRIRPSTRSQKLTQTNKASSMRGGGVGRFQRVQSPSCAPNVSSHSYDPSDMLEDHGGNEDESSYSKPMNTLHDFEEVMHINSPSLARRCSAGSITRSSNRVWHLGHFGCPRKFKDYIQLHPGVCSTAGTHASAGTEKGRLVVAALRKLWDKATVRNQPNMFFLLDRFSSGRNSTNQDTSATSSSGPIHLSSVNSDAVFYMILEEVPFEMGKTNLSSRTRRSNSLSRPDGVPIRGKSTLHSKHGQDVIAASIQSPSSPGSKTSAKDHDTTKRCLQYTLYGIEEPSRQLCKSVRRMLQTWLDGLMMDYFSDNLSRNAVGRLSTADFNFLLGRPPHSPTCHYYITLPQLFSGTSNLHTYLPRQLVLAFCYYLKQNLSLFLHTVKYERDTAKMLDTDIISELFMYNRPRAHGVANPGVATILFHLVNRSQDSLSSSNHTLPTTQQYIIRDWALPHEFAPLTTAMGNHHPTFDTLFAAIMEGSMELTPAELEAPVGVVGSTSSSSSSSSLALSVRLWEQGESDLENLRQRIRTTVLHSLYDVIMEFFVLTAPVKSCSGAVATSLFAPRNTSTRSSDTTNPEKLLEHHLNRYIPDVVASWLRLGQEFNCPLILSTTVELKSSVCVGQVIGDLFRTFHTTLISAEEPSRSASVNTRGGSGNNSTTASTAAASSSSSMTVPAARVTSWFMNGVVFHVYMKTDQGDSKIYQSVGIEQLASCGRGGGVSSTFVESSLRPGQTKDFLIVGRNFPAWHQLIRRERRATGGGTTMLDATSTLESKTTNLTKTQEPWRSELNLLSTNECDALLRMQPLHVSVSVNATPTRGRLASEDTTVSQPSTPVHTSLRGPFASGVAGRPISHAFQFCPISFVEPPNTFFATSHHSQSPSPSCSNQFGHRVSSQSDTATTTTTTTTATVVHPSVLINPSTPVTGTTGTPLTETRMDSQSTPKDRSAQLTLTIQVPRQAFCLILVSGRRITLYTYNWSKEEAERLSHRLTTLVDWQNNRYRLLTALSTQKMGLYHNLTETEWATGSSGQLVSLIHQTCPTELLGPNHQIDSTGQFVLTSEKANLLSPNPSSVTSGGGSSATKMQSNRRRYPTSGLDVPSPSGPGSSPSVSATPYWFIKLPVENFLRLFQDNSRIPPLDSSSGTLDVIQIHGRQAMLAYETDSRNAEQLNLLSLPFRAWQEGRRSKKSNEFNGADVASAPILETPPPVIPSFGKRNSTPVDAEKALSSLPFSERLKCFSTIRMACRHLHTMCTPILFSPRLRAQVVGAVRSENTALRLVAEECYERQQRAAEADVNASDSHVSSSNNDLSNESIHHFTSGITELQSKLRHSLSQSNITSDLLDVAQPQTKPYSPWLSWSQTALADTLNALTNHPSAPDSPQPMRDNTSLTEERLHKASLTFLQHYVHYIEQGVGFRIIPTTGDAAQAPPRHPHPPHARTWASAAGGAGGSGGRVLKGGSPAHSAANGSYVMMHRAIHLAGVHIMEIFIRHSHLYVRLGTIELGRFSRHASRDLITGALSARIITEAAASAAVTAASVRRDAAASVRRVATTVVPGSETRSRTPNPPGTASTTGGVGGGGGGGGSMKQSMLRWTTVTEPSALPWNESSRLCDYTHIHSFSYDYYIRAVQQYLTLHTDSRSPSRPNYNNNSTTSLHNHHGRKSSLALRSPPPELIGISDYPVTDLLTDLLILAPHPPVFARSCLRAIRSSFHVGDCLKPAQVFHHLIEQHSTYHIKIVRLARADSITNSPESAPTSTHPTTTTTSINSPASSHPHSPRPGNTGFAVQRSGISRGHSDPITRPDSRYTFGVVELQLEEPVRSRSCHSTITALNGGPVLEEVRVPVSTVLGSHTGSTPNTSTAANARYCISSIVVADERNMSTLPCSFRSDITLTQLKKPVMSSLSRGQLHLTTFLFATDPTYPFPKSRLSATTDASLSRLPHIPINWPAVAPSPDLAVQLQCPIAHSVPRLPRALSIESGATKDASRTPLSRINQFSQGTQWSRNRHTSFTLMDNSQWHSSDMEPSHEASGRKTAIPNTTSKLHFPNPTNKDKGGGEGNQRNEIETEDFRWHVSYRGTWPAHQIPVQQAMQTAEAVMQVRLRQLVERSGLDCHENLLWYRLFDPDRLRYASRDTPDTEGVRMDGDEATMASGSSNSLGSGLTCLEIEELLESAPFELDLLQLDDRLCQTVQLGARYIAQCARRFNHIATVGSQQSGQTDDAIATATSYPSVIHRSSLRASAYLYRSEPSVTPSKATQCHLSLLSLAFNEGFVLLSWMEQPDTLGGGSTSNQNSMSSPSIKYKNFKLRAIFRTLGDPMDPGSLQRLINSEQHIQALFFERSPLAALVTSFVELLIYSIWRGLHRKPGLAI